MPSARVYVISAVIGVIVMLYIFHNVRTKQPTSKSASIIEVDRVLLEQFERETQNRARLAKEHSAINKQTQSNQQGHSIDIQGLKQFEGNIRSKFPSYNPSFSALETAWHTNCINNLTKESEEDRKRYFKDQPKSEEMRHGHLSYLKPDSVVLEIGGNQGHDTSKIIQMYDPFMITLEPVVALAKRLKELFKNNTKVTVLNFGLGKVENEVFVNVKGNGGDATSMFSGDSGDTSLIIANTTQFLLRMGAGNMDFDLLLINCEGCEYEVLEATISSGLIRNFKNVQFAAHKLPGLRNQERRYCQIQTLLYRTHSPTYRYKYIWEHWRRMDLHNVL